MARSGSLSIVNPSPFFAYVLIVPFIISDASSVMGLSFTLALRRSDEIRSLAGK